MSPVTWHDGAVPSGPEIIIVLVVLALLATPALLIVVVLRTRGQGAPATPTAAPAWYPDPTQRHELRWFDGAVWTANVSDRGVTAVDPLA